MEDRREVRTAEVVCALSLASDLGMGQPMEHGFRACLVALRLAEHLGLPASQRRDVYYLALLRWVGCTAHAHELSEWFDDEIAAHARLLTFDPADPRQLVADLVRHAGAGRPVLARARTLTAALLTARGTVPALLRSSCEVAEQLCPPLAMVDPVVQGVGQLFERWDGKGVPRGLTGPQIDPAVAVVQLAHVAAAYHRAGGTDAALAACRERAGRELAPDLVAALADLGQTAFADPVGAAGVLDAEPGHPAVISPDRLDDAFAAVADFVDLKSPWLSGHSRAVAALAADAARSAGLPAEHSTDLRWAGYLHDLGRTAVPGAIWDRPGPLSEADIERVRLHPYWTERILTRLPALHHLGELAGQHHERVDGTGYHRGSRPASFGARLLGAADVFAALVAERPHRRPHPGSEAARIMRAEVEAGRLAADAVDAVLTVAGQTGRRRRPRLPGGLTPREVEVLLLLSQGLTNRAIAARLHVSERTAGHHVQHIYTKIGVTTRAAATLFALQHGLLPPEDRQDAR